MRRNEARKIIEETLSNAFVEKTFQNFVANLFKGYTPDDKAYEGQYIKHSFKAFIQKYKIIGHYKDEDGNAIDILEVALSKGTSLARARTAQRNFVAEYLKNKGKEAALVAFISPGNSDWRLSFVKLEHSLQVVDEKLKTQEEITPAKRWSFLVGVNEGSHTAQSRFVDLLINDKAPELSDLEAAFDIEAVTKEFFGKYTDLYHQLKEQLDKLLEADETIKSDFAEKEISTVDFAKKTLGQIVFLYFLQKKGWFGVAPGEDWGKGPKRFLRELYDRRNKYGNNFFNDILEPLFYKALAQDRGKDSIYPDLNNCRMPFLNGGLFEPMNDYKWETTDIVIPDTIFSNDNTTKEGDAGDGILDVFDRYNFTVNENEPLEKEVAVDPEMLGKVFENLLEIKDRKDKGAFYTPREIVHYMCQESLINYLDTETKNEIPRDELELFIRKGDRIIENDKIALAKINEKEAKGYKYKGPYALLLPTTITSNAEVLDGLLKDIKVADPAVGSGAFPLGMINEIVRARKVLNIYLKKETSDYILKKYAITHSIYGVDIDPGAVEIAKLRLWLALVVDEQTPQPLPNLDHKIMQGNSLIAEYEGIKLFDEAFLGDTQSKDKEKTRIDKKIHLLEKEYFELHSKDRLTAVKKDEINKSIKLLQREQKSLFKSVNEKIGIFDAPQTRKEAQEKTRALQSKIEKYIAASNRTLKQNLKEEIDALKWELIEVTLKKQNKTDKLEEIRTLRKKNIKPFFIWKLEFCDVFVEKGGFDVVIGNPPYVGEKGNKEIFREIRNGNLAKFYQRKMDIFYFFFHLALELGNQKSQNAFITTNYYITADGARKLRADFKERVTIRNLINFNELRIFESALGQHNLITIFSKDQSVDILARNCMTGKTGNATEEVLNGIVLAQDKETQYYRVEQGKLYDGDENYIRLGGVGNLDNPIEVILEKMSRQGSALGGETGICNINMGVQTAADFVNKRLFKIANEKNLSIQKGEGIYVLDNKEIENFSDDEKGILKPYIKNSAIYKYFINIENHKYLIYIDSKIDIERYPNIKNHLLKFKELLLSREQVTNESGWYWIRGAKRQFLIDTGSHIICPYRSKRNIFSLTDGNTFGAGDVYFITSKKNKEIELKYILALLNSKLYFQWLYYRGKRKGETLELYQKPLSEIPIKKISLEAQKPFIELVDKILEITSQKDYDPKNPPAQQKDLENQIDLMVYNLYVLTTEEIKLIESSSQ